MSKPDVLVYKVTERYKRPDLTAFVRASEEMHYPRALWGKGKIVERTSFEELDLTEETVRDIVKTNVEEFVLSDNFERDIVREFGDSFSFSDDYARSVIDTKKEEVLTFSDDYLKEVLHILSDTIIIRDNFERDIVRTHSDGFTITDDYARDITDTKNETVTLSDDYTKCPTKYQRDLFFIFDEDERNPNSILYDLEISENPLSETDFDSFCEHTTPPNFNNIRPLIAGEYEYQNAIVGVQVRVPLIQGRFGIIGSKLVLDVEDVVQKGRVKVDNTGKMFVKFNKIFYTIPHVIAALVDAETVGAVEVNDVSREGFYIGIKDVQGSGAYIEGTVDYLADGY